jgi:hypothetical protein
MNVIVLSVIVELYVEADEVSISLPEKSCLPHNIIPPTQSLCWKQRRPITSLRISIAFKAYTEVVFHLIHK